MRSTDLLVRRGIALSSIPHRGFRLGADQVFADFLVLLQEEEALTTAFFLCFALGDLEAEGEQFVGARQVLA